LKKRKWLVSSLLLSQFIVTSMSQINAGQVEDVPINENVITEENQYELALNLLTSPVLNDQEVVRVFIENFQVIASETGKKIELEPSFILAEMAVNSNWGMDVEPGSNNIFGSKEIILENENEKEVLKIYSTVEESVLDYYENLDPATYSDLYLSVIDQVVELADLTKFNEPVSEDDGNEESDNSEELDDNQEVEELPAEEQESDVVEEDKQEPEIPVYSTFSLSPYKNINYTANVISNDAPIYKSFSPGVEPVSSSELYGNQVYGRQEVVRDGVTYTLLFSTSSKEIGWIPKDALDIEHVLTTKNVSYQSFIVNPGYTIDSLPWGTEGYVNISRTNFHLNKRAQIVQEKTTRRATFVLVEIDGVRVGWVDKNSLGENQKISEKNISYAALIKNPNIVFSSLPNGIKGSKVVAEGKDYTNKKLLITKEMSTLLGTYSYVTVNSNPIGWVPKEDLDIEVELSSKEINYGAKIVTQNHSIDTLPYGLEGFEKVATSKQHIGKLVVASREIVTRRGTFVLVSLYGKELGWIDKNALQKEVVISQNDTHYAAKIIGKNNTIDTIPYGLEGFATLGRTTDAKLANQKVIVMKEMTTSRGIFAQVFINGREIGWVDKKALEIEEVLSTNNVRYAARVVTKNHSIDTLPYGIEGFSKLGTAADFYNKSIIVTQEKVTPRGTFVFIQYQGKDIGWIDKKALNVEKVKNTVNVNYRSTIVKSGYSIDTLPYGIEGFRNVSTSNSYLNKSVTVIQEKTTDRGTFALISIDSLNLGWIDKRALNGEVNQNTVFLDPGHGGSETGAAYFGVKEKDLNLTVSLMVKQKLEKLGYNVIISRTNDKYIDLYDRARMANASGADIFVSIHHNALGNSGAYGIESYHYKYDPDYPSKINQAMHNDPERMRNSIKLTAAIHSELIEDTGAYDRGVRSESFAVIRETTMPATLLELGFMSNANEIKQLTNRAYQNTLAEAIAQGIDDYFY